MSSPNTTYKVNVYHDETKSVGDGKWRGHILFFVPVEIVQSVSTPLFGDSSRIYKPYHEFFASLIEIREKYGVDRKFHFTDISGRKWYPADAATREVLGTTADALRSKRSTHFDFPLCVKFAVMFYKKSSELDLYGGKDRKEQKYRHDETILRILLKGALHSLYDENCPVTVRKLVTDGSPGHRPLDMHRIIWQLNVDYLYGRTQLRNHIHFDENAQIEHLSSDHKVCGIDSDHFKSAHMLQVADLVLGAVIRSCWTDINPAKMIPKLYSRVPAKKDIISYPIYDVLNKVHRKSGFRHSGHFGSFNINLIEFSESEVNFRNVNSNKTTISDDNLELSFE